MRRKGITADFYLFGVWVFMRKFESVAAATEYFSSNPEGLHYTEWRVRT